MTREELHTEVATLTGEIVGMVSDLSPFDYKRKAEIDKEILALFDRYEREMWRPATDPPIDWHEVLLLDERRERYLARYQNSAWVSDAGFRILIDDKNSFWRELPPGPEGGK